jgi:hypothetical protein
VCGQVQAAKQVDALQSTVQAMRQEGKQLQQQVAADLSKQQQEVQQLMTRHSADVAWDTIKQFKADQVCLMHVCCRLSLSNVPVMWLVGRLIVVPCNSACCQQARSAALWCLVHGLPSPIAAKGGAVAMHGDHTPLPLAQWVLMCCCMTCIQQLHVMVTN